MRRDLPEGTITLLFTDIEGSTQLLHTLGDERYGEVLGEHRLKLREIVERYGGTEVDRQGDAFFLVFAAANDAVSAAQELQQSLAEGLIKIRIALHTGTPRLTADGYVGADVHLAARLCAAGHGGQVLLSSATRRLVSADVAELGEHRLKDFSAPVPIYQLGDQSFAPLRTISNTNLPRPASTFVGRQREIAEVAALLTDGGRLVTLIGPGGTGKTRLAIQTAAELAFSFMAGVFWVPLASLRDPSLLRDTIASVMGAKGDLAEHIGDRSLLLVLDNLEQIILAAPDIAALAEACPNLRILATSRERLRVRGEAAYRVSPLVDPEGVDLFCERAGVPPDESIRSLCAALENLPLAIELAAARVDVLSPAHILGRLCERLDLLRGGRDAEPRQETLRATMEWSHELLNAEERRLFRRLAVFRGGFTLEAAQAVCAADLVTLGTLGDKSLLRRHADRFVMLETIREFAAEQLAASGEQLELGQRHAEHFLEVAERVAGQLRRQDLEGLERLDADRDNLRAALDRSEAAGETQLSQRLAGAMWRYWLLKGRVVEARQRLQRVAPSDRRPTLARALTLQGTAVMDLEVGDFSSARVNATEARRIHDRLGDLWSVAYDDFLLVQALMFDGDLLEAKRGLTKCRSAFERFGDEYYVLVAGRTLAWVHEELGERAEARRLLDEIDAGAARAGYDHLRADTLAALSEYAIDDGDLGEAMSMLAESLAVWRRLDYVTNVAEVLSRFGRVLLVAGEGPAGVKLLAASDELSKRVGYDRSFVRRLIDESIQLGREQLGAADFAAASSEGASLSFDQASEYALYWAGQLGKSESLTQ